MSWCHGGLRIVIHAEVGIKKVHDTVPCESHLLNNDYVSYKLRVYNEFCRKSWAKHHPCVMVRRSEGLHSLCVVRRKWLFLESSPDKGTTDPFSNFNSQHTDSGIYPSQYANFSKTRPYHSRRWFLDICWLQVFCSFKLVLYPREVCSHFFNVLCNILYSLYIALRPVV
jgi:hypothetical protein